jgi:hypothetical protein
MFDEDAAFVQISLSGTLCTPTIRAAPPGSESAQKCLEADLQKSLETRKSTDITLNGQPCHKFILMSEYGRL